MEPTRNLFAVRVIGLVLVGIGISLLHVLDRPNARGPLSDFSRGPVAWLYRLSFLGLGVVLTVMTLSASRVVSISLTFAAIGAVVAALVPSPGVSLASFPDRLHAAAMLALFAGAVSAGWLSLKQHPPGLWSLNARLLLALAASLLFITTFALKIEHSPLLPTVQ